MHDSAPTRFTPDAGDADDPDVRYFLAVAYHLDGLLDDETVLLTWHLDAFDERFRDSVVILVNDEKYQHPSWAGKVKVVFKTGGLQRNPLRDHVRLPPPIAARLFVRELRNAAQTAKRRLRVRDWTRGAPMFDVPLGYFGHRDVPEVPFADRPVDVFFAGSIERSSFTLRPRLAARQQMVAALEPLRARLPGLRLDVSTGGPMANPASMLAPADYSTRLGRARVVLCPRGNIDETYRLLESARAGCVAISEPLPARWYYSDSPAVVLRDWSQLSDIVAHLMADPLGLAQRGAAMRAWWDDTLSEAAVAGYIARHATRYTADLRELVAA